MSETCSNNPLPPPDLILRLGGLGNRRFGDANGIVEKRPALLRAAKNACREVLAELEKIMLEIHQDGPPENALHHVPDCPGWWSTHVPPAVFCKPDRWGWKDRCGHTARVFSNDPPRITVLTGGAEGGDSLIRNASLARNRLNGGTVAYNHLPIAPEDPRLLPEGLGVGKPAAKRPDLEAKVATKKPLAREDAHELAGIVRRRAFAYRAQSEALRHHSDVLLAIWDPDTEGKAGGTSESVADALRERIPVIAIRLTGPDKAEIHLLETPRHLQALQGSGSDRPDADWQGCLAKVLQALLAFPDFKPDEHKPAKHKPPSAYQPRTAFAAFCEDKPLATPWPARLWVWFDAVAHYRGLLGLLEAEKDLTKRKAREPEVIKAREKASARRREVIAWKKPSSLPPIITGKDAPTPDSFEHWYGRAKTRAGSSGMSGAFGGAHRGGIVLSYLLAASAVVLAVTGGLFHHYHMGFPWQIGVALAELGAILLMYALWACSNTEGWHAAYADSRILAEALRMMEFLGLLGVHTPIPRLPYYLQKSESMANPDRLWSIWYFRALVRMAPLRLGAYDPQASRTLVENKANRGQAEYHRNNATKQDRLHKDIERIVPVLFAAIILCATIHFFSLLSGWEWAPLFVIGLFCCIVGPAVIAAMHGFASQMEIARLQLRSSSMVRLLEERTKSLQSLDLTTDPAGAEAVWGLATEALSTAALLMDETVGWSMLYRESGIHPG